MRSSAAARSWRGRGPARRPSRTACSPRSAGSPRSRPPPARSSTSPATPTWPRSSTRQGKPIPAQPSFGLGVDPQQPRFNPFELVSGRWAGGNEVVLDSGTASEYGFRVGDLVRVSASGPAIAYRLVGVAKFGEVDSLGSAAIAIFDVPTAQRLHRQERIRRDLGRREGRRLRRRAGLAARSRSRRRAVQVRTGEQQAAEDGAASRRVHRHHPLLPARLRRRVALRRRVRDLQHALDHRCPADEGARDAAHARRLQDGRSCARSCSRVSSWGSSPRSWASRSASGSPRASTRSSLRSASTCRRPTRSLRRERSSCRCCSGRSSRSSPASSRRFAPPACRRSPLSARGRRCPAGACRAGRPRLPSPSSAPRPLRSYTERWAPGWSRPCDSRSLGFGVLGLFVGMAMLAPRLVRPLAAVVGLPAARLGGVAGNLARQNALRNPARTAATAAALMIGLTLVTFVAVLGRALLVSDEKQVRDQVATGYVITSQDGWDTVPVGAGKAAAGADGVELASSVRSDLALVAGSEGMVSGVDAATIARAHRFRWKDGSESTLAALDGGGAIVGGQVSRTNSGISTGDRISLRTAAGTGALPSLVSGVYDDSDSDDPLLGDVLVSQKRFDATFPRPGDAYTFVDASSPGELKRALSAFPSARLQTLDEFVDEPSERPGDDAEHALRPARPLRGREPARDDQHAGARGVRADTGARNAARGRNDAPPGAPDDPPRGGPHLADRGRDRAAARGRVSERSPYARSPTTASASPCRPARSWPSPSSRSWPACSPPSSPRAGPPV